MKRAGKHAALQRCGSRDIDAEYWGACLLLRLRMRPLRRAEVWGAQAAPTRRHSTEAATMSRMPLASNPLFALLAT